MIVDLLANSHLYRGLSPKIDRAFAFLHETDLAALEPGDYEIDGKRIYARALTYTTRAAGEGSVGGAPPLHRPAGDGAGRGAHLLRAAEPPHARRVR